MYREQQPERNASRRVSGLAAMICMAACVALAARARGTQADSDRLDAARAHIDARSAVGRGQSQARDKAARGHIERTFAPLPKQIDCKFAVARCSADSRCAAGRVHIERTSARIPKVTDATFAAHAAGAAAHLEAIREGKTDAFDRLQSGSDQAQTKADSGRPSAPVSKEEALKRIRVLLAGALAQHKAGNGDAALARVKEAEVVLADSGLAGATDAPVSMDMLVAFRRRLTN